MYKKPKVAWHERTDEKIWKSRILGGYSEKQNPSTIPEIGGHVVLVDSYHVGYCDPRDHSPLSCPPHKT